MARHFSSCLQVVASVKDLHKTIAAEVAKIQDIQIDVTPNMEGFNEKVRAETERLRDTTVRVDPDLGEFATQLQAKVRAASAALPKVALDANADKVTARIQEIRAELIALSDAKIGVDISDADAKAKIKELQVELAALGARSPSVQVKVDVAKASAELLAFNALADTTNSKGSILARSFGSVGSVVGKLVGVLGSGITSLGNFAGAGTAVGNVLGSIGTNVSSSTSWFGAFGDAVGSALTKVLPFLATGAQWVAMGVAIAGVGSVAVAGLGQLVGIFEALLAGAAPLVGLLGTLPGLIAPVGVAALALVAAFGDAGVKGALDQLKSSFQPVITALRNQLRPALQDVLGSIADLAPTIKSALPPVTSAISDVAKVFSNMFKSSSFKADLTSILNASGQSIRGFGTAAADVFHGLIDTMIAAQPAVQQLVGLVQNLAAKFSAAAAAGRASGEWSTFFQQGVQVLEQLLGLVGNVAGAFGDLWDAANRTGAFQATIAAISDAVSRFRDYIGQAGGSFDQLLQKAGPVLDSLLRLAGSVGDAFVQMGAHVDITGVLDKLSGAIHDMTPAWEGIAQAAGPALESVITLIGRVVQALGPSVKDSIKSFATVLADLGPTFEILIPAVAMFIKGFGDIARVIANTADTIVTVAVAVKDVLTGNLSGAAEAMSGLEDRTKTMMAALKDNSSVDAAKQSVQGLSEALRGIVTPPPITFTTNVTGVLAQAAQVKGSIESVPGNWVTRFGGDIQGLVGNVQTAVGSVGSVPGNHATAFVGDPSNVLAQAAAAHGGIIAVPGNWVTRFAGDIGGIIGSVGAATGSVNSVPGSHNTDILGNPGGVLGAASLANGVIAGIPPSHNTDINGNPGSAVGAAGTATGAINSVPGSHDTAITGDPSNLTANASLANGRIAGIPPSHNTAINAQDNSTSVISRITGALAAIPRVVTTIVRTITGGAAGMIWSNTAPMASGGIVGMANGGIPRLTPMSAGSARIVGPNTWRVIGDRTHDDEAFIPINSSARSRALLSETGRRMGASVAFDNGGWWGNQNRTAIASHDVGNILAWFQRWISSLGVNLPATAKSSVSPSSIANTIVVNNPRAEQASDSIHRELRRFAAVGGFLPRAG